MILVLEQDLTTKLSRPKILTRVLLEKNEAKPTDLDEIRRLLQAAIMDLPKKIEDIIVIAPEEKE